MKNDYSGGGVKISIPPTLLFTVLGVIDDVNGTVSSDFKRPGDEIFLLGVTRREMAGSEISSELGLAGARVPTVDAPTALIRYRRLHEAIRRGLVSACHDLSDGGLGVALAEMALGGRLGARVDPGLARSAGSLTLTELLYSESASRLLVTVPAAGAETFETLLDGDARRIGRVSGDGKLTAASGGSPLFALPVEALAEAYKATFNW
jgi:phosphoribosylformylglycinamidine synthase